MTTISRVLNELAYSRRSFLVDHCDFDAVACAYYQPENRLYIETLPGFRYIFTVTKARWYAKFLFAVSRFFTGIGG